MFNAQGLAFSTSEVRIVEIVGNPVGGDNVSVIEQSTAVAATRARGSSVLVARLGTALIALWIFVCALAVMKTGAKELAPTLDGSVFTDTAVSTLGFGWLSAMLVMSGSPIAASALTLLDGDVLTTPQAFTMLTGSRLGASFVVLTVAVIYAFRGGVAGRKAPLSIGIFSLVLTAIVYVPALAIGLPLLTSDAVAPVTPATPVTMVDMIEKGTDPVLNATTSIVPGSMLFLAGLAMLLIALKLFDRIVPETSSVGLNEHGDWRSRKWVMFGLGSLVALVTMSVAVALTVLVPLVAKGYLRRRQALPYIMGANIMTLGDTLMAALLIGNPDAPKVVVAELLGVTAITLLLLALAYTPLTEGVVRFTDWMLVSKVRLGVFVAALFCMPLTLVLAF
jgi:solute carrier family 34 (sodium-dependent phosphate cotransporter)